MDTFAVLSATSVLEQGTPYDGPVLYAHALGFASGHTAEGPLDEAGIADTIYANEIGPFPDWDMQEGFCSPEEFARVLVGVVLPVEA
jgi:hypothetical protein